MTPPNEREIRALADAVVTAVCSHTPAHTVGRHCDRAMAASRIFAQVADEPEWAWQARVEASEARDAVWDRLHDLVDAVNATLDKLSAQ